MQNVDFTLYATPLSANGRKVLALCDYLNLKPNIKNINVYQGDGQTAEFLAINPQGKIPTLQCGDFVLTESNAILVFIANTLANNADFSGDPLIQATIMQWLFWESSAWQPAVSTILAGVVGHAIVPQYVPKPSDEPDWQNTEFVKCINLLEQALQTHSFIVGDEISIADFSIAGMVTYFTIAGFPFEQYPHFTRWYREIQKLHAWQKTTEELWEK